MYAVLGAWVIVLAGVLDRLAYAFGHVLRRPLGKVRRALSEERRADAEVHWLRERHRSRRTLTRIDAVSQFATSLGLFGTVVGITRAFFSRVGDLDLAAPEVLAQGLATALFTTIAGLIVFLFGQGFLILYESWIGHVEGDLAVRLEASAGEPR